VAYDAWMRWLIAFLVAGCGDTTAGSDDSLIALAEGTTLRLPISAVGRASWDAAPWATVDPVAKQLVLAPKCNVVTGTAGAPRLFVLDRADGDRSVVVQVSPSGDGDCRPYVDACVCGTAAACTESASGTSSVPYCGIAHDVVGRQIRFMTAFDDTSADEQISFRLHNPDCADQQAGLPCDDSVSGRLTTDAPIHFNKDARVLKPDVELVGDLFNANVRGDFRISYEIARSSEPDDKVATGSFELRWGTEPFTIEPAACWTATNGTCLVKHGPTKPTGTSPICLQVSAGTAAITVALDVWIQRRPGMPGPTSLQLSSMQAVTFHAIADQSRTNTTNVDLASPSDGAKVVHVDLPNPIDRNFAFRLDDGNDSFSTTIRVATSCP
jgi:hypothetical protein